MLNGIIQLFIKYVGSGIFAHSLNYIIALGFLATVPCVLRAFIFQRGGNK